MVNLIPSFTLALPKPHLNQFKLVKQSNHEALRAYCPNIYTVSIGLTIIIHNWQMLSNKFYTHKTDFWCSRPSYSNFSVEDWRKLSTPWKIGSNESDFDNCQIFNVNFSTISTRPDENTENIPCTSWEYDTKLFDVSLNTY